MWSWLEEKHPVKKEFATRSWLRKEKRKLTPLEKRKRLNCIANIISIISILISLIAIVIRLNI